MTPRRGGAVRFFGERRLRAIVWSGLAAALLAGSATAAPVGERQLTTVQPGAKARDAEGRDTLRVTVWYRAEEGSAETSIDVGPPGKPLFKLGSVALDAPFADAERRPVILLSHGFGGSARSMAWFGKALAERGYVVVAPDHPGNNGIDQMTVRGAMMWWERAKDLKAALSAAKADPTVGAHIDSARVGVAGFSIGGLTALVAGGARVSPENIIAFCDANPADGVCRPQIEFAVSREQWSAAFTDPELTAEMAEARSDHSVAGVRAVFAMAPVVQVASPESLKAMRVPVSIITGDADATVPPATHARVAARLIPRVKLEEIATATHYSFLGTCTPAGREVVPVCKDAAAQQEAHTRAIAAAEALFDETLR